MALSVFTVTIPAGGALSDGIDCRGTRIARLGTPAAWTTAPLTFLIAALPAYDTPPADAEYLSLFHAAQAASGAWSPYEVSIPNVIPSSVLLMPSGFGSSISWLRLRSGTKQTPVPQTANRTFTLVFDTNP